MSRENVEVVRQVYDAAMRRDNASVLSLYDPDVVWDMSRHPTAAVMGGGIYRGHEGLSQWFGDWHEVLDDFETECEELIDVGDERVVSVATTRGRGRASGAEATYRRQAAIWTLRAGKIIRVVWFLGRDEALEAVGLRE